MTEELMVIRREVHGLRLLLEQAENAKHDPWCYEYLHDNYEAARYALHVAVSRLQKIETFIEDAAPFVR